MYKIDFDKGNIRYTMTVLEEEKAKIEQMT
jgi:hypothetical protein